MCGARVSALQPAGAREAHVPDLAAGELRLGHDLFADAEGSQARQPAGEALELAQLVLVGSQRGGRRGEGFVAEGHAAAPRLAQADQAPEQEHERQAAQADGQRRGVDRGGRGSGGERAAGRLTHLGAPARRAGARRAPLVSGEEGLGVGPLAGRPEALTQIPGALAPPLDPLAIVRRLALQVAGLGEVLGAQLAALAQPLPQPVGEDLDLGLAAPARVLAARDEGHPPQLLLGALLDGLPAEGRLVDRGLAGRLHADLAADREGQLAAPRELEAEDLEGRLGPLGDGLQLAGALLEAQVAPARVGVARVRLAPDPEQVDRLVRRDVGRGGAGPGQEQERRDQEGAQH